MSNRVVHFEIPCDQLEKTMKFFEKAFSWTFQQLDSEEYWFAITGDNNSPGINGGIMKKKDPNQPLANSIQVKNIDQSVKDIEEAGGTIVLPKMPIPGVGWVAYFKDPDDNIHGVYQPDPSAK